MLVSAWLPLAEGSFEDTRAPVVQVSLFSLESGASVLHARRRDAHSRPAAGCDPPGALGYRGRRDRAASLPAHPVPTRRGRGRPASRVPADGVRRRDGAARVRQIRRRPGACPASRPAVRGLPTTCIPRRPGVGVKLDVDEAGSPVRAATGCRWQTSSRRRCTRHPGECVMGVSAAGKSTVGAALAARGGAFVDAATCAPRRTVEDASGRPLTDEDRRRGWTPSAALQGAPRAAGLRRGLHAAAPRVTATASLDRARRAGVRRLAGANPPLGRTARECERSARS